MIFLSSYSLFGNIRMSIMEVLSWSICLTTKTLMIISKVDKINLSLIIDEMMKEISRYSLRPDLLVHFGSSGFM